MSITPSYAIEQRPSKRSDLLVFEITAKIHKADIEHMARIVDRAFDAVGEIDILLVFTSFDGASIGAVLDGKAVGVGLRSNAHVRRYGVVGAPMVAEAMINLFDPLTPVEARTFAICDLDDARVWIDAS